MRNLAIKMITGLHMILETHLTIKKTMTIYLNLYPARHLTKKMMKKDTNLNLEKRSKTKMTVSSKMVTMNPNQASIRGRQR